MIALALQAATPAAPGPEADVVVIGRRVREWRGTFHANEHGVSRGCRTVHSTGDAAIDSIGCDALVGCYTDLHPRVAAIMAGPGPRREREAAMAALLRAEMTPCLDRRYEPLVAKLAATRRAGAGS